MKGRQKKHNQNITQLWENERLLREDYFEQLAQKLNQDVTQLWENARFLHGDYFEQTTTLLRSVKSVKNVTREVNNQDKQSSPDSAPKSGVDNLQRPPSSVSLEEIQFQKETSKMFTEECVHIRNLPKEEQKKSARLQRELKQMKAAIHAKRAFKHRHN